MFHGHSCGFAAIVLAIAANAAAQPSPGEATPSGVAPAAVNAQEARPASPEQAAAGQPAPQGTQPAAYPATQPSNNYSYGSPSPAPAYATSPASSEYDRGYVRQANQAEPPPPESKPFELPTMSVRIDPLNWLLSGRLGLELETQVWKFVSFQLVPMFIVNDQPPVLNLNLSGVPNTLYQKSAGIGALAGTSVGVGFWLNGKPMEGYVLRAELTDYVIDYDTRDRNGPIDHVEYVDRAFQVLIGSHSKWGPVTLAGTFGLGSVLSKQNRCIDEFGTASTSGCANGKELSIRVTRSTSPVEVVNLHEWTYPIVLVFRISLGVVF